MSPALYQIVFKYHEVLHVPRCIVDIARGSYLITIIRVCHI